MVRLAVLRLVVVDGGTSVARRWLGLGAGQINVHATLVLLGVVLEAKLTADIFDGGLDLLDVIGRVVSFADNDVKMSLAVLLGVLDALGDYLLGLLDELAVQVNRVRVHAANGIVLAEDVVRGLLVVVVCFGGVLLGLGRHFVGSRAVSALVGLASLGGIVLVLRLFFAGEITQTVVLGLCVGRLLVVEGWEGGVVSLWTACFVRGQLTTTAHACRGV